MKQLRHISPQGRKGAFTLIEVVLAVAIASIGIIAILGLLPNAIQSSRDATDNTLSATIAQDVFANIRSQPLNTVNFGNGPHDFTIPISTNSPGNSEFRLHRRPDERNRLLPSPNLMPTSE